MKIIDFVPLTPEAETASLMTTEQFKKLCKHLNRPHKGHDDFKRAVKFMVKNGILNIRGNMEQFCKLGADEYDCEIPFYITPEDWESARNEPNHYDSEEHEEACKAWVDEIIYHAIDGKDIPGWTSKDFWRRYEEEEDLRIRYMQGLEMPEGYEPHWRYPEGKPSPFTS